MDWQDVQLTPPSRTVTMFPNAECPKCKSPHEMQIMNTDRKPYNLECAKCGKKFCSLCQDSRHLFGPCPKLDRVIMDHSTKRDNRERI